MELTRIAEESARGSFFLMTGAAASTAMAAVATILIARLIGPADYGLYSLVFVLPGLFAVIADFGVSQAVTRYAASLRSQRNHGRLASMIGSGLLFNLVAGALIWLLVFCFSDQLAASILQRPGTGQLVRLASVTILFQGFFTLSYRAFAGLDRMEQGAMITILRDGTRVIMSPLLIVLGFGVAGAILGQVFGWVLAGLLGVWFLFAHRRVLLDMSSHRETENGLRGDIRTMMGYGLPLYLGALLGTVLTQYQNVVLAFYTSNAEIGNFNAALNFGALTAILSAPIQVALFPAFSKLDLQTGKDDLKRTFELSVRYTTLLIVPVGVAVAVLSSDLIHVLYGAAYGLASAYLALYSCMFLSTALGYIPVGVFFSGVGRTRETLKITLVQVGIFLVAAPVMAWLYRVPGLIVALLISTLVAAGFGLWLVRKLGMHVGLKGSARALAAALASAIPILAFVYYSPLASLANVLIGGVIYVATYLTLVPFFGAVNRTDLEMLPPILSQVKFLRPASTLIFAYETHVLNALEQKTKSMASLWNTK